MKRTNSDKTRQKSSDSGGKKLRDQAIIAKAMSGMRTEAIAQEVGVTRQTVSEVLNSDEVKRLVEEIDGRLAAGVTDAIETVLKTVKYDYVAARDLLKNFGGMRSKVEVVSTGLSLADLLTNKEYQNTECDD